MKYETFKDSLQLSRSRPARGAWIEIVSGAIANLLGSVAPRTGRVD